MKKIKSNDNNNHKQVETIVAQQISCKSQILLEIKTILESTLQQQMIRRNMS